MRFKDVIGESMIGKTYHFKCDCIIPFDIDGTIESYRIRDGEIVFQVNTGRKLIDIGMNHPHLEVSGAS